MGLISQTVTLPDLGPVHIRVLSTAANFTARWRAGELHVTIPPGISEAEFRRAIEQMKPRLLEKRPRTDTPLYHDGFHYSTDDWQFTLRHEPKLPERTVQQSYRVDSDQVSHTLYYGPGFDFTRRDHTEFIAGHICFMAHRHTQCRIIPCAMDTAASLGLHVRDWVVSRGGKRLGVCRSDGRISLSERLAFLTDDLRRYIITHELAHLTHFDHSPEFNALWESYLGVPVAPLRAALRSFPFPLPQ